MRIGEKMTKNYQKRKDGPSLGYRTPDHFKGKSFKPVKSKPKVFRRNRNSL
jgi:hypothetical protein